MKTKKLLTLVLTLALILATFASTSRAGNLAVTHSFTPGTPAVAGEMNQNFAEVQTEINDNDTRIIALESALSILQTQVVDLNNQVFTLTHHSVGGSVSNLTGTGLILQNNGGDDLAIGDTSFVFATKLAEGTSYNVTVKQHPIGQSCFVTDGSGTMGGLDITNVSVFCQTQSITSSQIQDWLIVGDGHDYNGWPIEGATVTYVRPAIGDDMAGFYIQAEQSGPAVFIAVDPATLNPVPVVGDLVTLWPTDKNTIGGATHLSNIIAYTRNGQNQDVAGLIQDVTGAPDLVSNLDAYTSEMVSLTSATITGPFSGSGLGFSAAQIDTAGISGNLLFKMRIPEMLRAGLSIETGCMVAFPGAPMWRNNTTAEVSAWDTAHISVINCPLPNITMAYSTSPNGVRVIFSRSIAPSSIIDPAIQFHFDNGLATSAAVVMGDTIDLTTTAQVLGQTYTLTVLSSVTDLMGAGIDPTGNQVAFAGYDPTPAGNLVINEVDYDNVGTDDNEFVEIYNPTTASVDLAGVRLSLVNGVGGAEYASIDLTAAGTLAAGEYLVVGSPTLVATLPGGTKSIAFALASNNIQNGAPDGIALVDSLTGVLLDALSYEGEVTSVTWGSLVEGTATPAQDDSLTEGTLCRCPNGTDSNNAIFDWQHSSIPTPGTANSCQ